MIELKCVTREKSAPKGKFKVYFSCKKEDFKYFEDVTKDILKIHDCAIYYLEDVEEIPKKELKDYKFQLSQMQLFVFPITNNFLTNKSRSLNLDFKLALEKKIPILPLMYGEGLADLFKEKCGRLQYLNKFKKDDTAISYEQKLTKFLNNVFIDDELIDKARKAFDRHIFLSYRKKDRLYANEIMKQIHKNDFAKDIAIWFDEFLTPGEDYSDEIKDFLKKSDLFALVVTPNLVEGKNYVMNEEYPDAKKHNKAILPIESVKTDKELLKESFKDIPECVELKKTKKLSKALLQNLKNLAVEPNNDPVHNFYVGLAYIYGIDVEINREKGIKLVADSAVNGYFEAVEFLADAYSVGHCVKYDNNWAAYYNNALCEFLVEDAIKEDSRYILTLAERLDDLFDNYVSLGEYEKALKCSRELEKLEPGSDFDDEGERILNYYKLIGCNEFLIYFLLKDYKNALLALEKKEKLLNEYKSKYTFETVEERYIEYDIYRNFSMYYAMFFDRYKVFRYLKKAEIILNEVAKIQVDEMLKIKRIDFDLQVALALNNNGLYKDGITACNKLLKDIKNLDIADIEILKIFEPIVKNLLSKCYFQAKEIEKAIETSLEIVNLLSKDNKMLKEHNLNFILLIAYHDLVLYYHALNDMEKYDFYGKLVTKFGKNFPEYKNFYYTGNIDFLDRGCSYIGNLKYGYKMGKGVLHFADGSKYEGDFVMDARTGFGVLHFADGSKYEGEWKDDFMTGKGKLIVPNKYVYEGEFKNNLKHGYGKTTMHDGNYHEGLYENDIVCGKGKIGFKNGDYFESDLINRNLKVFKGTMNFANGKSMNGIYTNGIFIEDRNETGDKN